ncbi:glutamyl-tRNA(Gln) amidotransferase subunit B, mitochondrial-like [Dreissena polymorpha]|uniref:Glutamyl-tRNA(Gln) amidotransferase subunit B, mitochondrial n=1 Tax=Dreissena polymorpha TaxID=45954 RepID=A0A9D4JXQ1_DREPO|nr:glutamyl-tRNA(Gln) amidotransferase subunit B, mitochondrial-like [Dreissena polymorpha]KAH3827826.1 hypothetical protein DPMN_129769 [Dreissena polymorpha]
MSAPIQRCKLCQTRSKSLLFSQLRYCNKSFSSSCKLNSATKHNQVEAWQPVIGLEIHAQIKANSKLFSRANTIFGGPTNSQVAFLDAALPGTLPVLNRRCVEAGVITALALGCQINKVSRFDRKHYFYADLPAGYQITQQNNAIANNGRFHYVQYGNKESDIREKAVTILQLQLEQDSGKSLHDDLDKQSLIDLNRAGCGLMEIVTAPEFHSGDEARSFVRDLRQLLVTLGTCDGKMSEGSLRVDANISVHKPGQPLGERAEVKNLNSLSSLKKTIEFEIKRQIAVIESGGRVINETRSFDLDTGETLPMRDKEVQLDYRFMPEPNLPPLRLYHRSDLKGAMHGDKVFIDDLEKNMPVLPQERRGNLMQNYGISMYKAAFIVTENLQDIYEELVSTRNVEAFTNFFINTVAARLLANELTLDQCPIPGKHIGYIYDQYKEENINLTVAEKLIDTLLADSSVDPKEHIRLENLWQINDVAQLTELCKTIIAENPKAVSKLKRGKDRAMNTLMASARKATGDRGNTRIINRIFKELIAQSEGRD